MAYPRNSMFLHADQHPAWCTSTDPSILGRAVKRLKARVEWAYHFSQEDKASAAHDDLVAAEWRLRQAQRRNGVTQ